MHFSSLLALLPLLAPVLALDKPLDIEVTEKVECERKTKAGDMIHVHYRGTLGENGNEFDASYNRGQPLAFTVGRGQVIKGWDKGLLDMCVGEKRKLTIQPEFGYGDRAVGPIPAGSVLSTSNWSQCFGTRLTRAVFETELMDIGANADDGEDKDEL
jgi:FK506-binding protein 2